MNNSLSQGNRKTRPCFTVHSVPRGEKKLFVNLTFFAGKPIFFHFVKVNITKNIFETNLNKKKFFEYITFKQPCAS